MKLNDGQKNVLRLIANDARSSSDGWARVSAAVYPLVQKTMPVELVEHESVGNEGRGRARLTPAGQHLLDAMAWL